jgi:hypothetical protein
MARRPLRVRPLALTTVLAAAAAALAILAIRARPPVAGENAPALEALLGWPTVTPAALPTVPPQATPVAVAGTSRPLVPGQPRQLLGGGCCAGAWWAEDSSALRYIDRPDGALTASLYTVAVWPPGTQPVVLSGDAAEATLRDPVLVGESRGYALVQDVKSGDKWPLPTNGNPVRVSRDGQWAAWWTQPPERMRFETLVTVTASDIYGFDVLDLVRLWGAEVVGFASDNERVVVVGGQDKMSSVRVIEAISAKTGQAAVLDSGTWLGDALLSVDGSWVVYCISMDTAHPEANGIWAASLDGAPPQKLPFEGAYHWRDGHRLVYVPLAPGDSDRALWEVDVATMATRKLVSGDGGWLRIADNDWSVSPDGRTAAFVNELDRNVWVVDLPE